MGKRIVVIVGALGLLISCYSVAWAFRLQADKENVVASRLEGRWVPEPKLTLRLTGREVTERQAAQEVSFVTDETVVDKIPQKYQEALGKERIYLCGVMKWKAEDHPFILIAYLGNPCVVYFRERDGDPMGDAESLNVMLAPAKDKDKDLLFIGGDHNNQPFSAYERAREAK